MKLLTVLGLGSNKGDSRAILAEAVSTMRSVFPNGGLLTSIRQASLYETDPVHVTDQSVFLNTAVAGYCSVEPRTLLQALHRIEQAFGRNRSRERRWGERTLDIDILLFGNRVVSDPPYLEIPHPRLTERAFALEPLVELVPDAQDPLSGRLYRAILAALPSQGVRRIVEETV